MNIGRIIVVIVLLGVSTALGSLLALALERSSETVVVEPGQRIPEPEPIPTIEIFADDAHQQRMLEELQDVQEWAQGNRIFISEVGVPSDIDTERYGALMAKFYEAVNAAEFDVTVWAVGKRWGDYPIAPHNPITLEDNLLSPVYTANLSTDTYFRGVNLAGAEFGLDPDAGGVIGAIDDNYTYHSEEGDDLWQRIADKGYTHVRFPFRLERLFDPVTGAFREDDRAALVRALERARLASVKVVLDPHNYAALQVEGKKEVLGGDVFTVDLYTSLLKQIATLSAPYPDVVTVIGLMNEPKNVKATEWEVYSRAGVRALREGGWRGTIEVPTAKWQGAQDVSDLHRKPWIDELSGDIVYGVHQYYDWRHGGVYDDTYTSDEEKIGRKFKPRGVIFTMPR